MYQIAVCEDETLARESLCGMCGEILSERNISYEITPFSSAEALEGAMAAGARFDLLCLDILMGGKSGMDFAASCGSGMRRSASSLLPTVRNF